MEENEKLTFKITMTRKEWETVEHALIHFCVYSNEKAKEWEKKSEQASNAWRKAWDMSNNCWLTFYKKLKSKK